MWRSRSRDPDRVAYLRSARWIGLRVALVSAALVVSIVVAVVAYVLWQMTPAQQQEQHGPEDVRIYLDTVDIAIAIVGAGGFAVVAAGLATWILARRAVRPLGEALRMQRNFVADASHELRTPLTVLSARLQQLRSLLAADDPAWRVAEELTADTRILTDIVDDLLQTAAGESGELARTFLAALLETVTVDMGVLARERQVQVQVQVSTVDAVVAVPLTQLRRCLVALMDNAIAHSPAGGVVDVTVRRDDRSVFIRVRDQGGGIVGIAPGRVFDRFAHGTPVAGASAASRRGYGIGLALVRDVAVRHGGDARIERTGTDGTTFVLRLPLARQGA